MFDIFSQFANALFPIVFTLSDVCKIVAFVQFSNALSLISIKLLKYDVSMAVSCVHPLNAFLSIFVIVFVKLTDVIVVNDLNALSPISTIPNPKDKLITPLYFIQKFI